MPEQYEPRPGFWRPKSNRPSRWVRDTEETILQMQEVIPAKPRNTRPDGAQLNRESAFRQGEAAHQAGRPRTSSGWHRLKRSERSQSDDDSLACFEQGWDTSARRSDPAS